MPPAAQQGGQSDNAMAPIWIIVAVFTVLALIWYFLRVQIVKSILFIKLLEIDVISLFTSSLDKAKLYIKATNPADVSIPILVSICNQVGVYLAGLTIICLLIFAFFLYKRSIGVRFRTAYNMKSLLRAEVVNWPQTTPVVALDLAKEDINAGIWAMSKTPMQFAKMHNMLKEHKKLAEEGALSRETRVDVTLNRQKAVEVFVRQLGRPWEGIDALNMHTKALFAAFAARANGDIAGAAAILRQISISSHSRRLNFSGVKELLDKYRDTPLVAEVTKRHAFVFSVMATMIELARTLGVQASADFLWLKPIDRRLWYMMNSVGRQTPVVEAAGPFAHWLVEKRLGRKIVTPMIEEAVKALDEAIQSVIYKPGAED